MSSYSSTESTSFTVTHAKHMAAKVATDLKRLQRFYGNPSDYLIDAYESEMIELLRYGYLNKATYGFEKSGDWIEPTLIYTADDLNFSTNDDPGKIRPGKDVSGASFYSFLEYSFAWNLLPEEERTAFKKNLSIQRGTASTPGICGYLDNDKTYSSGGKSLARSSVRSYA